MPPDRDFGGQVAQLERAGVASWPARETMRCGGWTLRFAGGFTHRANSVATFDFDGGDLDASIDVVEAEYRARGLDPMFQVTPATRPGSLESRLRARGYKSRADACVCAALPARVRDRLPAPDEVRDEVRSAASPDAEWAALAISGSRSEADGRERLDIVSRIALPHVCVASRVDMLTVAVGMGVLFEGRVGINLMRTSAAHRRKGHARRALAAIADWAVAEEASLLYLSVELDNLPARALYAAAGFEHVYDYRYWRTG